MAKNPIDEEDDDLSDFDFTDASEDEFDPFEDDDFFGEDEESIEKTPIPEKEEGDQIESQGELEGKEIEKPLPAEVKKNHSKKNEPIEQAPFLKNEPISPEELPVVLTMEIGRVELPVGQLIQLEPGNLLELSPLPLNGVDLTISGKIVGKGELIRIGDILGVRVTQLG